MKAVAPWLGAFVAALGLAAAAQQPSFRAGTELVVVDVAVVDKDGAPVKGLQASDFTLTIDGRPRAVRSLRYVEESGQAAPAAGPGAQAAGGVSSNEEAAGGRLALIVVDEESIPVGRMSSAAQSITRLLDGFGPADKIGLASLPGPRLLLDFTRDRAALAAAIKRIPGGAATSFTTGIANVTVSEAFDMERDKVLAERVIQRECGPPSAQANACAGTVEVEAQRIRGEERKRTTDFINGLRRLLVDLAAVDGPKVMVLFSAGLTDPEAATEMVACGPLAASAGVTLFAMRLDPWMDRLSSRPDPAVSLDQNWSRSSLETLANVARGATFNIIGSADEPFSRLARELSGYYLLGVDSDPGDRDGKPHPIKVSVDRPGVTLRARREVLVRAAVTDEKEMLARALRAPLAAAGVPLRVRTFNVPDEDAAKVRVLVVAEVDRDQAADGPALVAVLFTDDKGRTTGTAAQRMTLPRSDSGALSLMVNASLAPGAYTMKLAVSRDGRVGTVEHHLVASLTGASSAIGSDAAGIQMGELVVTAPARKGGAAPGIDARVSGDQLLSFVPVRLPRPDAAAPSFTFDVVKDASGAALLSAAGGIAGKPKGRVGIAEATLDVRLLPPGEYGIRVNVMASGAKLASLFAPFRRERTPPAAAGATGAAGPRSSVARFDRKDVLDPVVLGPFLEEVARLSPPASRPALELARDGRIDEAARLLEPGHSGDPALPFLRGLALFQKGDLQPASNQFRAAIAEAPELLVGAFYLGACYAAGGKDSQAAGAWQTALVSLNRYPAVYRFLGDALMRTGQSERAQRLLADAAARWPGEEGFRPRLVAASVDAGRYQQALDYADRLVADQPEDASLLFLAMRSAFQALLAGADVDRSLVRERLERYRELYAKAGGLQQPLVDEWVRFARAGQRP